jgi:thioredoxin reductase (NADPH)
MPASAAGRIVADAVVIGAGPVGLFQVFQLGLHEIHVELVDALPHLGGQCAELYPDKPIYDIPGLPRCSGRELTERLREQMAPMRPGLHLGHSVSALRPRDDGRFELDTRDGPGFDAGVVVIAAGVGAFEPRRLTIEGAEALEGRQVHHHLPEPGALAGQQVVVLGGEDPAVDTALALTADDRPATERPASVTLLHRREVLKAEPHSLAALRERIDQGRLRFVAGQPADLALHGGRLHAMDIVRPDASLERLPADHLLVRQGLSPRLGPLAGWGLAMERKQLSVDTAAFETSLPGVHAVGDINTYPGKKKLIVCGFHEATLAAFAAAARLFPERPQHLQYTTTSPRLHALLGVAPG